MNCPKSSEENGNAKSTTEHETEITEVTQLFNQKTTKGRVVSADLQKLHDIPAIVCRELNSVSKSLRAHLKLAASDRKVKHVFAMIERRLFRSDMDMVVI